jgi:soluble lytic murein transglycosylase
MSDALYYYALANLSMSNEAPALQALADLRRVPSASSRVADLIYSLGRYHEKRGRDSQAGTYYQQLIRQFPESENADEAHFWVSWRAHETKDYVTASRLLTEHIANYGGVTENRGKAGFWAAVDSERAGDKSRALTIYRAMLMRYGAGWYGLNSERRINKLTGEGVQMRSIQTDLLLRRAVEGLQLIDLPEESLKDSDRERVNKAEHLIRIAMHQSAMNELDAARAKAPNSPLVNLRIAQVFRANGENVAAINALKRAYPDYGQTLPEEMSREAWDIFYPLKWWQNINEEARRHGLDPYFVAGIIRQETVFDPQARSRANALGLMQILPSTGQAVARQNIGRGITSNDLFNPVLNIQLGTAYVKDLLGRFGRFEYVAAAYNGGPTRVSRWLRELPAGEIEEWVESIPLSETRLYVQGVYRNARQYQRLYDEQGRFRSVVPER